MTEKHIITESVDRKKDYYVDISRKIWSYAEGGYREYKSSKLLQEALEEQGFTVENNLANIETAFKGTWGNGKPVIGILGEFDSLPGLSQKANIPTHDPLVEGARGHGCGHNLLGTGALAAAVAIKEYLEQTHTKGTVVYFGTPAEEVGSGKAFMARDGVFDGVDFFYTWHPSNINDVGNIHNSANYARNYEFKGVASHAAATPHLGRSALDAVELMSVGVNYLREHIIQDARLHYAYQDAGGIAPNVVQNYARVKYLIRAPHLSQVDEITKRVDEVAQGAALMSGTTVHAYTEAGYSEYLPNVVLARVADKAFHEIGVPEWTAEDYALAKAFDESLTELGQEQKKQVIQKRYDAAQWEEKNEKPLDTALLSFDEQPRVYTGGSTDVGDVGFIAPTVSINVATESLGTPGHSWQKTGQVGGPIGEKGMIVAAKVLALASIDLLLHPELIHEAKEEFLAKNGGTYRCPVSKDTVPPLEV